MLHRLNIRDIRDMAISAAMTLTPEEIGLVRASFSSLAGSADLMATVFYGRLFELDPSLRGLFKISLVEQSRKLIDTLTIAIEALDRFENIRPRLAELGRKHVSYGTQPLHYETVNTALVWALQQTLGDAFDERTRGAWLNLLNAITRAMLDVCEQKGNLLGTYERAVREYHEKLGELHSKAATVNKSDYERLRTAVERARLTSEKVRFDLEKHVRRHRC